MKAIKGRIAELEKKAGLDREVKIVLVRNYAKGNPACGFFEDIELCPPYNRIRENPKGMNENGFIIFTPPCKGCVESMLQTGRG